MASDDPISIVYAPLGKGFDNALIHRLESAGFFVHAVDGGGLLQAVTAFVRKAGGDALLLVDAQPENLRQACDELGECPYPIVLVENGECRQDIGAFTGHELFSVVFRDFSPEQFRLCLQVAMRRWRRETELIKQAEEAHVMALKELHHRVKNHLNTVQSFLYLQENDAPDACRKPLAEARARIRAVAELHDLLAYSKELDGAECGRYLDRLVRRVVAAYGAEDVELDIACKADCLHPRQLAPVGLILTELVTNALRHAFAGRADGRLAIRLDRQGDDLHLTVADNGPGLPDGFDANNVTSLGLTLCFGLVEQLRGRVSHAFRDGLVWDIVFPPMDKDGDSPEVASS